MFLTIETEANKEILPKYGVAVALNNSVEYLMGEVIIFLSGLNTANQETINQIFNELMFRRKLELVKNLIKDTKLIGVLRQINRDRNLLAHGINMQQGDKQVLMFKNNFHPLTLDALNKMIARSREALNALLAIL